ncbi:RraA family protein [Caenimonas aquaedulcis]|uniref:Putative 4-hydroxy-4-methyl-2-oxoglutarate aldolase n=1 Tax=Caenimonas aquaedulcis TaxID=2793270 RepID=A0A931H3Q6_9BURK|nr:hypothetical protein [Caenimonas aquaedulcis]MBG9388001.1 hypothetical protein [Caenimonas aquaedulcis]
MTEFDTLDAFDASTLYDAARRLGLETGVAGVTALAPGMRVAGPSYTVQFVAKGSQPKGSRSFYDVMAAAPAGSVMVVQVGIDRWISGANMSRFAALAGISGIVMDGCVRDIGVSRSRGYPIFSKGSAIQGYGDFLMLGATGIDIQCGGLKVSPDDIVVGDDDGVVVLPRARLDDILYEAQEILELDRKLADGIEARLPLPALDEIRVQWSRRRPR